MKQPFEKIVSEHGATVLRVCRAVLGPHADADDAWSETFLAALRAWPTLPADTRVDAWLVRVAHRKAIDVTRSRQRREIPVDEVPDRESSLGVPGDEDLELWAAVQRLPHRQRQAVAYHHLAGLPYREVAEILGGTTDAARRAAADGIKALRTTFTGDHSKGRTR